VSFFIPQILSNKPFLAIIKKKEFEETTLKTLKVSLWLWLYMIWQNHYLQLYQQEPGIPGGEALPILRHLRRGCQGADGTSPLGL